MHVIEATRARAAADHAALDADNDWRAAIRAAVAARVPVSAIAREAGVKPARVYQIRDNRR